MIRKTASFARALAVLSLLESDDELAYAPDTAFVEAYQNGREQGILIWGFDDRHAYYVAESRNSDELVVYRGKYNMQSISEDAYGRAKYFQTVDQVVAWLIPAIVNDLNTQDADRKRKAAHA